MAALATTQALSTQARINFTRLHEREADRIGMQILADAGFDPNGASNFFLKTRHSLSFYYHAAANVINSPIARISYY